MSIVASEKSPRLLYQAVQELYDNLHEHTEPDDAVIESSSRVRVSAGFILSRAEALLLAIREQLDVPYASKDKQPLMIRLHAHVHNISELLTGVGINSDDPVTLQQLIQNVQQLNRSVCTTKEPVCSIQ